MHCLYIVRISALFVHFTCVSTLLVHCARVFCNWDVDLNRIFSIRGVVREWKALTSERSLQVDRTLDYYLHGDYPS